MKHPITLGTLVAVLLILSLSACKPRSPNEFGSSIGSALPDKQPSQVVSSTSTPTVDVATDDAVPSFQEIENNIYNITHTPEHPNGADVGPDGIVNQDVIDNLHSYNVTLRGKRVEGWIGCAVAAEISQPDLDGYDVEINMDATKVGTGAFTEVSLERLTAEQIGVLDLVASAPPLEVCRRVKFSGTFGSVGSDGRIEIKNVTAEPIH